MGKLEIKTLAKERRRISTSPIRRSKNRAGIIESSVKICGECGEEFCFGESCGDILYDSFIRVAVTVTQQKIKVSEDTAAIIANMNKSKKKIKKKKGMRVKVTVSAKRNTRLMTRCKVRKNKKNNTVNDTKSDMKNDQETIKIKKFKRKCSKYSKKKQIISN